MGIQSCFHALAGREFLGMRISRRGEMEIVYDNGPASRIVWRVLGPVPSVTSGPDSGTQSSPESSTDSGPDSGLSHSHLAQEASLSDALRIAMAAARVVPTLHLEMKKRAIVLETINS